MSDPFNVLIVEDDLDARRNMEDILALDGYHARSESHCLPAINAIESERFDAVIIDWKLPDGDGGLLIPIVLKRQPNTPVIVITGLREFDTAVTALRKGAYDFLLKPINPEALRSVVGRLVERKQHLDELHTAQEKLVSAERLAAIGEMVAGLAHESRNAFQRSHACLAELSLDLHDRPDSLVLVNKVQKALDDINRLLEEVREYSAPIVLERRKCELESLVRESWSQLQEARPGKSLPELVVHRAEGFPYESLVDDQRMKQVIRNLLENAIYATDASSQHNGDGKVYVNLEHDPDSRMPVRIEVADNGCGIPPENLDSIFAPFFTTKTKGTGLGLAISQRIVQAHEGELTCENASTGGARFTIQLPRTRR